MAVLGLLLVAVACAIGVETAISNTETIDIEAFGYSISNLTLGTLFLAGAAIAALLIFGLWMMGAGAGRWRRRRGERKHLRAETKQTVAEKEAELQRLADERDRLRTELDEERRAQLTMGGVAVPPGMGTPTYGDQLPEAVSREPYPTGDQTDTGDDRGIDLTDSERDATGRHRLRNG